MENHTESGGKGQVLDYWDDLASINAWSKLTPHINQGRASTLTEPHITNLLHTTPLYGQLRQGARHD